MKLGSNYGAYARIPLCPACGNPYIPPGYDGHCSVRCISYLAASRQPVLGSPMFGPHQSMLCRGGCGVRFDSRGLVLCVDCWDRSRPTKAGSENAERDRVAGGDGKSEALTPRPVRHDEPIQDRNPRSRCHW
jgi:hypothetical protein